MRGTTIVLALMIVGLHAPVRAHQGDDLPSEPMCYDENDGVCDTNTPTVRDAFFYQAASGSWSFNYVNRKLQVTILEFSAGGRVIHESTLGPGREHWYGNIPLHHYRLTRQDIDSIRYVVLDGHRWSIDESVCTWTFKDDGSNTCLTAVPILPVGWLVVGVVAMLLLVRRLWSNRSR